RTAGQAAPSARGARAIRRIAVSTPVQRATAGAIAAIGLAGAILGAAAWSRPPTSQVPVPPPPAQAMTFSYQATVPRTPAYDSTTVTSPDPIFRKTTNTVRVRFSYQGQPGTLQVDAELSNAFGWHSTVPLAGPRSFPTGRYDG